MIDPLGQRHYFHCECGCQVLSVNRWHWDENTDEIGLVLYGEHHAGWRDRLRHIWWIIRYGHPWASTELLLSLSEARRLGELLVAALEES